MSAGVFAGAALGGAGLAVFGYPGLAGALVLPMIAALGVAVALGVAARGSRPAPRARHAGRSGRGR